MPLTREELKNLSWRQLGFQLREAMVGSNPNLYDYFSLLCEAKRRSEEEIEKLKRRGMIPPRSLATDEGASEELLSDTGVVSDPDFTPPSPDQSAALAIPEKIADMTHKGSGL